MRVCMVSTAQDARDDRLYYKEAKSLAKEHEVTLMAPSAQEGPFPADDHITFVRLKCKPSKVSRALMAIRLLFTLPRGRYDVIHISDNEMLPLCPLLRWRCNVKIVCDIWEANYEQILGSEANPGPVRRVLAFLFRIMERWAAKRCDLVLTADEAIADSLRPQVEATVIFNYPLLSVLSVEPAELGRVRKQYEGNRCLIYHGSMTEARGVLAVVEAMGHVRVSYPTAKLLLVGHMQESLAAKVRGLMARLELEEAVELVGWVDHSEVGKYLAISEIGLVPFARTRKFEKNIPQKIFEYWAFGIPVLATDLPPIRHFVDRCGGGLLLKESDPQSLADGIRYLLEHREEGRAMGEKGRAKVEQEWRWEAMEELLLDAYRRMGSSPAA